jgi:hypothetical protein
LHGMLMGMTSWSLMATPFMGAWTALVEDLFGLRCQELTTTPQ